MTRLVFFGWPIYSNLATLYLVTVEVSDSGSSCVGVGEVCKAITSRFAGFGVGDEPEAYDRACVSQDLDDLLF